MIDDLGSNMPVLQTFGLSKSFGNTVACDSVDLTLRSGEIHGLLGENGAGKSTLMGMIFGLVHPDSGRISLDGEIVHISDPAEAVRHGIGMVHQHYSLVDALTVWENVALGELGHLDPESTRARIRAISWRYGLSVDPEATVRDLSAGMRQRVEIIKCLVRRPRILLLDEPTAALTPAESKYLFDVLVVGVRTRGWAVAFVSHKLDEIMRVSDRITVMRNGRVAERFRSDEVDSGRLARALVGRPVELQTFIPTRDDDQPADEVKVERPSVLVVDKASVRSSDGRIRLDGLSMDVSAGEVVGVAGVEGNGQTALADLLSGSLRLESGSVSVAGEVVPTGVAGAMVSAGVGVIPADRHRDGCVPEMSVAENLMISRLPEMSRWGLIDRDRATRDALNLINEYQIQAPGPDTLVGELSGGHQQRTVVARVLSASPKVLVAHQPARGLDIRATEYVVKRLRDAAEQGIGVILISTDLGEILALSDRVVVIHRGQLVGRMDRDSLDLERLGLMMGGRQVEEKV